MITALNIAEQALSESLEIMAFMDIFPLDDEIQQPVPALLAGIDFSGPQNGRLEILAGNDFADVLAENFAAQQHPGGSARADAVKELANVTCGLIIPLICNTPSDIYNITVPDLISGDDCPEWKDFIASAECRIINTEGMLIAVKLKIDN